MTWSTLPVEGPADLAVAHHQLLAALEVEAVPVVLGRAALGHGIEAEGRLALGGQLGEEPGLAQLFGDPGGVLGDLGQRDVGGHRHRTRRLDLGLERPQAPQVGAENHEAEVGLVAEQGGRNDLVAVRPAPM